MTPPKTEKYEVEYATTFLGIAKSDLVDAKTLFNSKNRSGRAENIAYLISQACEKMLKAIICANDKEIVFTHDHSALLLQIEEQLGICDIPRQEEIKELTDFAVARRYESGLCSFDDVKPFLGVADELLAFASAHLSKKLNLHDV